MCIVIFLNLLKYRPSAKAWHEDGSLLYSLRWWSRRLWSALALIRLPESCAFLKLFLIIVRINKPYWLACQLAVWLTRNLDGPGPSPLSSDQQAENSQVFWCEFHEAVHKRHLSYVHWAFFFMLRLKSLIALKGPGSPPWLFSTQGNWDLETAGTAQITIHP